MGKVSLNKKRDQTSHAIGFKGPKSHLYLHFRRQTQRCELLGRVDFRTRSHIHHGQGICRLDKALSNCKRWCVFCHSGQGQSAFYQIQVPPRRQSHGIAKRPDRETHDSQIKGGFPHIFKAGSLLRRRKAEAFGILNKQLANSGVDCGQALQKAVGNRIIFQMDQRQLGNQALLRNECQRGEDANLDSGIALFDGGNPSQKPKTARKPSQYSTDFERSPV